MSSHLSIALLGAFFLILSLLTHEILAHKVFSLVLENSPRVELLHTIGLKLQRSQIILQEAVLLRANVSKQERDKIWQEIWLAVNKMDQQASHTNTIEDEKKQLLKLKGLLNDINEQQKNVEEIAVVPDGIQVRRLFLSQLRPLNDEFSILLIKMTKNLERRLDEDVEVATTLGSKLMWASRIMVLLMIFLAIRMARKGTKAIIQPLKKLEHAANEYAKGKLSVGIAEDGSSELKALSRSFNSMRHSLQESYGLMGAVLDTAAEAIIRIDSIGQVEAFNQSAEKMFGWHAKEVIGKNISMLMPSPYHEAHDGYLETFMRTRVAHVVGTGREVQGLRKDGSLFPIYLSVSHVKINNRHVFTGIINDISEQKKYKMNYSLPEIKQKRLIVLRQVFWLI
ncbi:PAS domain S-box protein [sulfur-oxidizing endosymbiont of Gigantopelta aegis]|uniref:PAS domain S-box protein n=1 Tax=sulfur-oxidizing endosymbiont of Gigantopelta aegis TaxID=2794934 RepID=UPI0018DBD611|nr:PAS domain S-box protein [sulfur-oxidizing endosymbiont of Gigantopelta aegis]